jgi:endonuclease/exonuclease/phosphatase family metal-dependent hydrolase
LICVPIIIALVQELKERKTMASILDSPPPHVQAETDQLNALLDATIPPQRDDPANPNLLIATWNIKKFGSLTREWTAGSGDSPKRDQRSLLAINEIIKRFDVVAVQEVTGNLRALRETMNYLGEDWGLLMTDIVAGAAGNSERMAFLFNRQRLKPSGLAAEVVIPNEWLEEIGEHALQRQFARTPYAASFLTNINSVTFILTTLHVDYSSAGGDREAELHTISRWLKQWARRSNSWHHNLITLGDFNIDRKDDSLWQAFTSTGLHVPEDLNNVKRSIFADDENPYLNKFYDQIAWFQAGTTIGLRRMDYVQGGGVDFVPLLYQDMPLTKAQLQHRMSDHFPLWVEFNLG